MKRWAKWQQYNTLNLALVPSSCSFHAESSIMLVSAAPPAPLLSCTHFKPWTMHTQTIRIALKKTRQQNPMYENPSRSNNSIYCPLCRHIRTRQGVILELLHGRIHTVPNLVDRNRSVNVMRRKVYLIHSKLALMVRRWHVADLTLPRKNKIE